MDFIKISAVLFLLIQFSNISSGCPEGWKSFIDDQGYADCFTCRKCPNGSTVVENCTKEHETICDECTVDEFYHILSMQCKTCTVCETGFYVKMNCSRFKDTKCDVCPTGTFSLVKNSITCTNCTQCNGTQVMLQKCNNTVDTICGECTDDEYYHSKNMQCKTCTACDAGYYVSSSCSRFKNTECNVCPSGTFSSVQSSSTCKNCTDCRETKIIQACSRTVDTVCEPINGKLQLVQRVVLVVDIIISVVLLIYCVIHAWRHRGYDRKCKNQEMETLQDPVRCVSCEKRFAKADTEPLVCGHKSICPECISKLPRSTCTSCGIITVRCVICKRGFAEEDTEPLVCGHQSVCCECNSTRDCSTCTTCGKNTVRCVNCKKGFAEEDTVPLVCGHQSVCHECNSTRDCSTCTTCGRITGNSSCGAIVVNPNKQTDKRYQRSESSEFTLKPDKELTGTDKEQRMKSSMSTPGELHERPSRYKVRNINVREKSDKEKCVVSGLVVISRDFMVVCDNNNSSVKLIDTKQNIVTSKIRLPSEPWDTALVPRDVTEEPTTYDLIVTLPVARKLRYVRVNGDQITDTNKDISVEGWCQGIQVTQDRKLAVGYYDPEKVEILDMDGQVLRRLETYHDGDQLFYIPFYLAVSPGSGILYVSDEGNSTLTSVSTRDWSVMTKLEGLDRPHGVTVDRAGSVFVCCWDGTVHLVAATGDRSTQILGEEDGLCWNPQAIGLSPEGDRMYVSGYLSDHVQEFQLTEN